VNAPRYTTRVPAGRPVVVEPDHRRIARRYVLRLVGLVLLVAAWVVTALVAASDGSFGLDRPLLLAWIFGGVLVLVLLALVATRWRGESRGPLLVADPDSIWLRMGGTLRVRGLSLPWEDVDAVSMKEYRRAPILCIESKLGEAIVKQHADDLLMEVRRRRRWCDSSFAVHSWYTGSSLPEIANRLRVLAGDRIAANR
jgi:hypothetical protein